MNAVSLIRYVLGHELNRDRKTAALRRFLKWQVGTRLNPHPVVMPFTEKTRLVVHRGMVGATQNIYCGLHEFSDMGFLLHFLRPDDLFVDIGANVGTYTVLAAAHIGAKSISCEPVPQTFSYLRRNVLINDVLDRVSLCNVAVGAAPGTIQFTTDQDAMNHVATEGEPNTVAVPVTTLDAILMDAGAGCPVLLKVDVEGYETEVLRGAAQVLSNPGLQAIIIELNGSGRRYGYDEQPIHELLCSLGFLPYTYQPFLRKLTQEKGFGSHNTIYLRDAKAAQERLNAAAAFQVNGHTI
jgi:FkbM family methyltransferase